MVFKLAGPRRPAGGEDVASSGAPWAEQRDLCCDALRVTIGFKSVEVCKDVSGVKNS